MFHNNQHFITANSFTQKWEKGYVNHPNDPGGATYNGVSLRFLKQTGIDVNGDGHIDVNDILTLYKNRDQETVDSIFYKAFWRDPALDLLESFPVQTVVYDCNVNTGRTQSAKCLQRACNFVTGKNSLVVDGVVGPKTRALVLDLVNQGKALALAHAALEARLNFHNLLVSNSPYNDGRDYRPFAKGWRNRVADLKRYVWEVGK